MNPEHLSHTLKQAMNDLPFVTDDLPGIGGALKAMPEHFQVEEVLPYEACGQGEHLYVTLRRKGWNTVDVARELAGAFNMRPRDVGYGGRKDKQAVTTQTFSIPMPMATPLESARPAIEALPFDLLSMDRHRNKIKTGHVDANRFRIVLTGIADDALPAARAIGDALVRRGVPNFYGQQRFGFEGRNLDRAAELVARAGTVRSPAQRFLVSALQSALFNVWLKDRIQKGRFDTIIDGDVAKKTDTGGMFIVEDLEEAVPRFEARQIIYTGPMFGHKMRGAQGRAGELELRLLERFQLDRMVFKPLRADGSRRAAILRMDEMNIEAVAEGLEFRFCLPSGAYATTVMREFMR